MELKKRERNGITYMKAKGKPLNSQHS